MLRSNIVPVDWSTFGVDLHLDLPLGPDAVTGRRLAIERAIRDAVRSARLAPQTRLPSSRALAAELGLARGTVSAAYEQLVAEGFLSARTGSGTVVAGLPSPVRPAPAEPTVHGPSDRPRYDLRPGRPDVTSFPVDAWLRATRRALAHAPSAAFDYGPTAGRPELRAALAEYLGRARGVLATPDRIVVTTGYVQALALLTRAIAGRTGATAVAMEDPGLAYHRDVVRHAGGEVLAIPVDHSGARTDLLATPPYGRVGAVVLTPAHQYPLGVTLSPERRRTAIAWARAHGTLVVEDDYDGEFRYDRHPVGALQATAPEDVVYIGTAAKTLAPALRLGWLVLPERWVEPVVEAKHYADRHSDTVGQLALADLITTHTYDRHVRSRRLRYRRRRDLLIERVDGLPGGRFTVGGVAAGLHATIGLPADGPSEAEMLRRAESHGLAVADLGAHWQAPGPHPAGLIVGYSAPGDRAFPETLDVLIRVLRSALR
jgi:GntR family transcriptional regulator/MocR family aminotransferase